MPGPERFPRKILLCVTGLSPQVITETLHALAVARPEPFVPTEIHLITTSEGAERARLKVLEPGSGNFWRLCTQYGLDAQAIRFNDETIHVIGHEGGPLEDIRDAQENRLAADTIMSVVRTLTQDDQAAIHASIAGGRKTMGFFLGYALSLLGRPQDRLSHVLVSAPFESHPEFYFPPKQPVVLESRDGRPVRTDQAKIELAEIPFIRLRDEMPEGVLGAGLSFSETVALGQTRLERQPLRFDCANCAVWLGGVSVSLPPSSFALYLWLARRRKAGMPGLIRHQLDPETVLPFAEIYARISGEDPDDNRVAAAVRAGMSAEDFDSRVSRLNSRLKRAAGKASEPYRVSREGRRPYSRYGLSIGPNLIIEEDSCQ